jgi:phosphate-selective porin OprO/OprP
MNSLSFQGEYIHSFVDPKEGDVLQFKGYYAYVSYFPTGETRPYDTTRGVFTTIRPRRNLSFRNRTYGGLEIHARYSHLDLNDRGVEGGRMNIGTAGLTWHPYPIFKMRFSYGLADIHNVEGDGVVHIFQSRFEVNL